MHEVPGAGRDPVNVTSSPRCRQERQHCQSGTSGGWGRLDGLTLPVLQLAEGRAGQEPDKETRGPSYSIGLCGHAGHIRHRPPLDSAVPAGPARTWWDKSPQITADRTSRPTMGSPASCAHSEKSNTRESDST